MERRNVWKDVSATQQFVGVFFCLFYFKCALCLQLVTFLDSYYYFYFYGASLGAEIR